LAQSGCRVGSAEPFRTRVAVESVSAETLWTLFVPRSRNEDDGRVPRRLSHELGLADEQQDWGIINADGDRLDEFVRVYRRDDLDDSERFQVVELVLASANEALEADAEANLDAIRPLLPAMRRDAAVIVEYWERLAGDEFPLASWLRAAA
jgi:hypothetical protein